MFLRIGDQQFGWVKGGFFSLGRTAFRPPVGPYQPSDEIAFLQRYMHQLELELVDLDRRMDQLAEGRVTVPQAEAPAPGRREPVGVSGG